MAVLPTITRITVTSRPMRGPTSSAMAAATASKPKISAAARSAARCRRGGVGNEYASQMSAIWTTTVDSVNSGTSCPVV